MDHDVLAKGSTLISMRGGTAISFISVQDVLSPLVSNVNHLIQCSSRGG